MLARAPRRIDAPPSDGDLVRVRVRLGLGLRVRVRVRVTPRSSV